MPVAQSIGEGLREDGSGDRKDSRGGPWLLLSSRKIPGPFRWHSATANWALLVRDLEVPRHSGSQPCSSGNPFCLSVSGVWGQDDLGELSPISNDADHPFNWRCRYLRSDSSFWSWLKEAPPSSGSVSIAGPRRFPPLRIRRRTKFSTRQNWSW